MGKTNQASSEPLFYTGAFFLSLEKSHIYSWRSRYHLQFKSSSTITMSSSEIFQQEEIILYCWNCALKIIYKNYGMARRIVISLKECSMMIDMKRRRAKISQSLNEKWKVKAISHGKGQCLFLTDEEDAYVGTALPDIRKKKKTWMKMKFCETKGLVFRHF